jgi:hypothetical protein
MYDDDDPGAAARTAQDSVPRPHAQELPAAFVDWQVAERRAIFAALERGELPRSFAAHLPVVSTLDPGPFPIHSATKGAGLTPKDADLPQLVGAIEDCLASSAALPWPETLARRIEVARLLYDHPEHIDRRRFGLIEIFRGQTYRNILRDPRVTLLFTGPGPQYLSYQVHGVAEVVGLDDARFRFILGMRHLFERDRFHIQQPDYAVGYLLWVHEVIEKTPRQLPARAALEG